MQYMGTRPGELVTLIKNREIYIVAVDSLGIWHLSFLDAEAILGMDCTYWFPFPPRGHFRYKGMLQCLFSFSVGP